MPHKHTRKDKDESTYDLPPTQRAIPLPVVAPKQARQATTSWGKSAKAKNKSYVGNGTGTSPSPGLKRKRSVTAKEDDAPRTFKRLMAFAAGNKFRNGLDDGIRATPSKEKTEKKKRKAPDSKAAIAATAGDDSHEKKAQPTIRPGETMSDFARRVDAEIPVMGLVKKSVRNGQDPLGVKVQRTRKEKKMHKLYDEWRREETIVQERRREEAEEAEEREMNNDATGVKSWMDVERETAKGKKTKKGRKAHSVWEVAGKYDEDPWAELKKRRGEKKIGLHDVVKAPPELKARPKQVFRLGHATVDVGTVPKAAGSLRRREELRVAREDLVAAYRKMVESRRMKPNKT